MSKKGKVKKKVAKLIISVIISNLPLILVMLVLIAAFGAIASSVDKIKSVFSGNSEAGEEEKTAALAEAYLTREAYDMLKKLEEDSYMKDIRIKVLERDYYMLEVTPAPAAAASASENVSTTSRSWVTNTAYDITPPGLNPVPSPTRTPQATSTPAPTKAPGSQPTTPPTPPQAATPTPSLVGPIPGRDISGWWEDDNGNQWVYYENYADYNLPLTSRTYRYRLPWELIYSIAWYIDSDSFRLAPEEEHRIPISLIEEIGSILSTEYIFDGAIPKEGTYIAGTECTRKNVSDKHFTETFYPSVTLKEVKNYGVHVTMSSDNGYEEEAWKDRFDILMKRFGLEEHDIGTIIDYMEMYDIADDIKIYNNMLLNLYGLDRGEDSIIGAPAPAEKISIDDLSDVNQVSAERYRFVEELLKYQGLPYVYGGGSLETGTDCSGFIFLVKNRLGQPWTDERPSAQMTRDYLRTTQKEIRAGELQPGDIICYWGESTGWGEWRWSHVSVYIGDGLIIHERNVRTGCVVDSLGYWPAAPKEYYRGFAD